MTSRADFIDAIESGQTDTVHLLRCPVHGFVEQPHVVGDEAMCPQFVGNDDLCDMPLDGSYSAEVWVRDDG